MPHIKFDPMKELEFLSHRMRKFADEFPETFSIEFGKGFEPKIDVYQDNEMIRVVVELPGLTKTEVRLSYADNILTIGGEKKAPEHDENTSVLRTERSFGEFKREVTLPKDIDAESLEATMVEGVLTVTMRKLKDSSKQERTINIS
jgi:HSP20 family protein